MMTNFKANRKWLLLASLTETAASSIGYSNNPIKRDHDHVCRTMETLKQNIYSKVIGLIIFAPIILKMSAC